ncbi:MAG: nicotinate-nucleotide adenylyltransferase [Candidatus Limnocylindria bacterium]
MSRERAQRLGLLGGTFDPPHVGHLWLATLATGAMGLDRVLFIPAGTPPHKRRRRLSAAADRTQMVRLAIADNPAFELCEVETARLGPSYTVETVEELQRRYPAPTRLVLVMAADSLAQIDSWREPDRLLSLVEWAVGPRPGSPRPDRRALRRRFGAAASRVHLLDGPALDVSSTQIRRRVAADLGIRYLVPRNVEELIRARGFYHHARS